MKGIIRRAIAAAIKPFGYELTRPGREFPPDFTEREQEVCRLVRPFTMTGDVHVACLMRAVEHVVRNDVPGDIAECGVWRGGSMMAAALALLDLKASRDIYLYDTYQGMPASTEVDRNWWGEHAEVRRAAVGQDWCLARLEEVRAAMQSTGYEKCRYIAGLVEDTIPAQAPERIALLRLDTDFYSSTLHELKHLYPRLSPGGILIIDDYGSWEGARKAVDEYFAGQGMFLSRVNASCRLLVKPIQSPPVDS